MGYALLADVIVIVHFMYVSFVVGGELFIIIGAFRRWGWIRNRIFRCAHLLSIVLVAAEAVFGMICPLTVWEYDLRRLAGQNVEQASFMGRLVHGIMFYDFPPWAFTVLYIAFALAVVVTLIVVPPRWRRTPTIAAPLDDDRT